MRFVGQSPDIEFTWYGPQGRGRHHSLPVCMRFRGVVLSPSTENPAVLTDGRRWMREFFLHRGKLLTSYREYLRATFAPWSPAGVHVIVAAPVNSMSTQMFAAQSERLAQELTA